MKTKMGFTKDQWIIIRLLYIMLAIDPTLVRAKDVELTMKYLKDDLEKHFGLLRTEHRNNETFNAHDIHSFRNMPVKILYPKDKSIDDDFPKKVFGITYKKDSKKEDSIIEQILEQINKGFK